MKKYEPPKDAPAHPRYSEVFFEDSAMKEVRALLADAHKYNGFAEAMKAMEELVTSYKKLAADLPEGHTSRDLALLSKALQDTTIKRMREEYSFHVPIRELPV